MNAPDPMARICVTCGTQFPSALKADAHCPICEDERQYIGLQGQQWTTLEDVRRTHKNRLDELEPGITSIRSEPSFAIGQRAFLIESRGGNVLWDCVALLDDSTVKSIRERGGIGAFAISHPHYYSTMVEWMDAFDVPVLLHSADRKWIMRSDDRIRFWDGDTLPLHDGMTLIRGGGHFEGGAMLHHPSSAAGLGALFSGDIIQVVPDRRWVSFMYSYPNLIPLSEDEVRRIAAAVAPFRFDRIYGAFHPLQVMSDGNGVVRRSADRYVRFLRSAPNAALQEL